jgi:hypothetical protein
MWESVRALVRSRRHGVTLLAHLIVASPAMSPSRTALQHPVITPAALVLVCDFAGINAAGTRSQVRPVWHTPCMRRCDAHVAMLRVRVTIAAARACHPRRA